MIEKEQVEKIIGKYKHSYYDLSENSTRKEFKTVLKYIVADANRKQKKIVSNLKNK